MFLYFYIYWYLSINSWTPPSLGWFTLLVSILMQYFIYEQESEINICILIFKLYNFLWTVYIVVDKKNPQNIHKFEKFCIIKMFVSILSVVLLPVLAHVCLTEDTLCYLWFYDLQWNLIKLYYKQLGFFFHIWTIFLERIQIYTDLFESDHTEKAYNIKKNQV